MKYFDTPSEAKLFLFVEWKMKNRGLDSDQAIISGYTGAQAYHLLISIPDKCDMSQYKSQVNIYCQSDFLFCFINILHNWEKIVRIATL